jgi:hypothetical protein
MRRQYRHVIDAANPSLAKSGEREWPWKAVLSCDLDSLFGCTSAGVAISE